MGISTSLSFHPILLAPISLIILSLLHHSQTSFYKLLLALLLGFGSFLYASLSILSPEDLSTEGVEGYAYFSISSVVAIENFGRKSQKYNGKITQFFSKSNPKEISAKNIPCTIFSHQKKGDLPPSANSDYLLVGTLKPFGSYYRFEPEKNSSWLYVEKTWSMAQLRLKTKEKVEQYIKKHILDPNVSDFLSGIATGNFNNKLLSHEFGRFGLQHIMAISGFHFSILSSVLCLMLQLVFSQKLSAYILTALLSGYFIFLGASPSIIRAWLMAIIALFGFLIEKEPIPLNSMGVAMGALLIYDPWTFQNLGFQFSFLATAAILLFYSSMDWILQRLFPTRSLSMMIKMPWYDQHGYIFLCYLRQAVALTCSVHLVSLPMVLFTFHKFPWLSLIYNLFFPFLVSVSLFLLIVAFIFSVIFPYASFIFHSINNFYTKKILDIIFNTPTSLDYNLRVYEFSKELLILYLCLVFFGGIIALHQLKKHKELKEAFTFI